MPAASRRGASRPGRARIRPGWLVLAVVAVLVVSFAAVYAILSRRTVESGEWRGAAQGPQVRASAVSPSPSGAPHPGGNACVTAMLGQLTVQEKAGQVLMIGTSITTPATLAGTMRQYHLGGVFLSGHTTQSAATLSQSIASLQGTARAAGDLPVHIALDQEGGEVQSLRGTDFPAIPSALQQGGLSQSALRTQTTDWARRLAHAGVSLDLAPVADTVPAGTADLNPPIGQLDRQFGSTPAAVAQDVGTVVTAAQAAGVLTTLKHFPGLGRVHENTDKSTKAVDNTTTATDPSLDPFASGIHAGTAAVMISSATYPKLDPHSIATFSSAIVTGLLRQRLGFTGLIVSDDLGAAVAPSIVPAGQRAVRFIQAGGDMVLTVKSSDAGPMVAALVAAAHGSATFAAQLTEAARQVIASKVRAGLVNCPAS